MSEIEAARAALEKADAVSRPVTLHRLVCPGCDDTVASSNDELPSHWSDPWTCDRCGAAVFRTDGIVSRTWTPPPEMRVSKEHLRAALAEVDRLRAELAQLKAAARGVLSLTGDEPMEEADAVMDALAALVGVDDAT